MSARDIDRLCALYPHWTRDLLCHTCAEAALAGAGSGLSWVPSSAACHDKPLALDNGVASISQRPKRAVIRELRVPKDRGVNERGATRLALEFEGRDPDDVAGVVVGEKQTAIASKLDGRGAPMHESLVVPPCREVAHAAARATDGGRG